MSLMTVVCLTKEIDKKQYFKTNQAEIHQRSWKSNIR